MAVTRALIPCGGRGTRMRAITGGAPKELIPVAGVPVLGRVLGECAASGVTDVLVVVAPEKDAVADFARASAGAAGMPARVALAVQPEARGLADAIRLGREFAGAEPLAVALPDNLFTGAEPGLAQVISAHERTGTSVVSVVEIRAEEAARRGPTASLPGRPDGDLFHFEQIPSKGERGATFDTGGARSAYTAVGRYVFTGELWPVIDEVERGLPAGAELDDVPVLQRLHGRGRLVGRLMRGRFLDVGLPDGYREAERVLRGTEGRRDAGTAAAPRDVGGRGAVE